MQKTYKPAVLIILDGWGYREEVAGNPIAEAKKPYWDYLWQTYPHSTLSASGPAVGLPEGQIGTSEVCHLAIGAGRALPTDLVRINKAIAGGSFATNPAFAELFAHVKQNNSTLHIFGLLSDGGVHSHIDHLFAFLDTAKAAGLTKIAVHAIVDGRDVPPQSADIYLKKLEVKLTELGVGLNAESVGRTAPAVLGQIASVCGRYYAMDRDQNWDRTAIFESLLFEGKGIQITGDPSEFFAKLHQDRVLPLDELAGAYVSETPVTVGQNDGIFFFNFRSDRAKQITHQIDGRVKAMNLKFAIMTHYDQFENVTVAFPSLPIAVTLAGEISKAGLTQAHIAETEKFAHATYFLNGLRHEAYPKEKQILIESRKDIKTHDEAPEMKASEIADTAVAELSAGADFIFINFANADMVGHTGNVPATIRAVEFLDGQIKKVVEKTLSLGGAVVISADHGNAEECGDNHTAHTTNPVPVIVTAGETELAGGKSITTLAATALELLGLAKPAEMDDPLF